MTSRATPSLAIALRGSIRDVADFPQPGILFKDLTPVLADPALFSRTIEAIVDRFAAAGVTHVAAIESRGFLFGAPVAERLGAGLVPLRKAGRLPHRTVRVSYALEYGEATLEAHADAVRAGDRVLVVDDVLATGGTARAAVELMENLGATVVGLAFIVAIESLDGRARIGDRPVQVLLPV